MSEYEGDALVQGMVPVTEGEWAGWSVYQGDPFEDRAGPFYERFEADGAGVLAFRAETRHMNGGGFMHGGCLMTFADAALFTIARRSLDGHYGVTMHLAGDFLSSPRAGQLIEARGEVLRGGGKTLFVRGVVTADSAAALGFTGIIRKLGPKR